VRAAVDRSSLVFASPNYSKLEFCRFVDFQWVAMKNIEKSFVLGGSDVLIELEPLQRTQGARGNEISCATT
jgi:hypothetical protein